MILQNVLNPPLLCKLVSHLGREREGTPNTRTTTPHTPTMYEKPSANVSTETEPTTPGQDDDPERIDDVV